MGANRQKMKIFQGSGSWVVPMENIFCLVWDFGLEFEVGIPWPIFSNFTMWYISPALKNSCIWGIRVLFLNLKNSRFSWPDLRGVHITNNLKNSRFSLPDLPGIEWTLLIFSTAGPLAWLLISLENENFTNYLQKMRKQYLLHSYKLLTCRMKGLYGNFSAKLVIVFSNKIVWKKKNLGNV